MGAVVTNTCVCGCGRTLIDGYAATDCTEKARQQLAEIGELVAPARDVAHRQTSGDGTGGSGVPGSRVPLDLAAGARLDAVQVALTGWARELAESRSVGVVPDGRDVIVLAAAYIAQSLEIARHKEWIDEMLREIGDCVQAMRDVTAGRRERIYLGTCGAMRWIPDPGDDEFGAEVECDGDVYGPPDGITGRCRICKAEYDQGERLAQLGEQVIGKAYRASVIAHAYGLSADTIRSWATERLGEGGVVLRAAKLWAHGHDRQGRPLYLLGEVLALAKQAEQRRRRRAEVISMGDK